MAHQISKDPSEDGIRRRLNVVADKFTQAEIARRTGVSSANVSRYLRGNRIPATFTAALTAELGVNPAWLLTGEGQPFVADITAGTVKMAGDVLELVEAMNAVSQMRLGALTGKHHLSVLRELNTALTRYDELRERLNVHSAPIFERLLQDLSKALAAFDVDRAIELRKALTQVERLGSNPGLSREFKRLQARLAMFESDADSAIRHQQGLVREPLTDGRLTSGDQIEDFLQLSLTLQVDRRNQDALRLCRAFDALTDDRTREHAAYPDIRFFEGSLMARLGNMAEGMRIMQHWNPRMRPHRAEGTRTILARHMVVAGLISHTEVLHLGRNSEAKFGFMGELAEWQEDPEFIRQILDAFAAARTPSLKMIAQKIESVRHLLLALEGQKDAAQLCHKLIAERWPSELKNEPEEFAPYLALIAITAGDRREARKWHTVALKHMSMPENRANMDVLRRAVILRNEMRLEGKQAEAARAELRELVESGYWMLRSAI